MAAIIEVKYFNTFLLKKVNKAQTTPSPGYGNIPVWNGSMGIPAAKGGYPRPNGNAVPNNWVIEESRINGGYNNTTVSFGAKAYLVEENPNQQWRFNSMIYSGVFNSRTGVNYTNQFPSGTNITRSVDPINASIQKLYAEDTNLIIFQENKVLNALIDKDAIYTAEGQAITTLGANVIGSVSAYAGNFGISKNPESFAVYGYNKYFTDKDRNSVMMLSSSGLSEISNVGMFDFFRDSLRAIPDQARYELGFIGNKSEAIFVLTLPALNTSVVNVSNIQGVILPGAEIQGLNIPNGITVVSYENATNTLTLSQAISYPEGEYLYANTGGFATIESLEASISSAGNNLSKILRGMSILNLNSNNQNLAFIEEILPGLTPTSVKVKLNKPVRIPINTPLSLQTPFSGLAVGSYDYWAKNYTLSLQSNPTWTDDKRGDTGYTTLTFDQVSGGWTSFYSYKPSWIYSLKGNFYSVYRAKIYKHYTNQRRNNFYGINNTSSVTFIFNPRPTTQKVFETIEYEGSNGWQVNTLRSDSTGQENIYFQDGTSQFMSAVDTAQRIRSYTEGAYNTTTSYPAILTGQIFRSGFDKKENKYVAPIKSNSSIRFGEVLGSNQTSGIKGFLAQAIFSTDQALAGKEVQLFSVGTTYHFSNGY